jgi:hypothetical protein
MRLDLLKRWGARLSAHGQLAPVSVTRAVHRARGYPPRVLIVDDYIPDPSAGAGFGRMFDVVVALATAGYAVSHYPTRGPVPPADALIDCGMEIVEGDLAAYLARPDIWVDVLLISRPHNFDYAWPAVRTAQPWAQVVYDCEALWWRRLERQAQVVRDAGQAALGGRDAGQAALGGRDAGQAASGGRDADQAALEGRGADQAALEGRDADQAALEGRDADQAALEGRDAGQAAETVMDAGQAAQLQAAASAMQQVEERNIRASDLVVTVSDEERAIVRALGVKESKIVSLPPVERGVSTTTSGFAERRAIGFVAGWMAGADSPNGDGLRWFAGEVLPRVRARIPWVQVSVTGRHPPRELMALSGPNLRFEGHVADLAAFYERMRVIIAPMRFGSGVKLKTMQAIQHGVPTVATSVGAEGVPAEAMAALCVTDDPEAFAAAVIRLLTDEQAWQRSREAMLACTDAWQRARTADAWPRFLDAVRARRVDGSSAAAARR